MSECIGDCQMNGAGGIMVCPKCGQDEYHNFLEPNNLITKTHQMNKIKLHIKTLAGEILFEFEKENNTIKETVTELLKAKKGEWIKSADLSDMDLSGIDFSNSQFDNSQFYNSKFYNSKFDNSQFDNSQFYNSQFDNSKFYNSQFYNSKFDNSQFYNSQFDSKTFDNIRKSNQLHMFNSYKADFWMILLTRKAEIAGLKEALKNGIVNGSSYEGRCSCLVGTIANVAGCDYKSIPNLKPDAGRPAERWFFMIKEGDTPETSEVVKLTMEWIEEFEMYLTT